MQQKPPINILVETCVNMLVYIFFLCLCNDFKIVIAKVPRPWLNPTPQQ